MRREHKIRIIALVTFLLESPLGGALSAQPYFVHNGAVGGRAGVEEHAAQVGLDLRYSYRPQLLNGILGIGLDLGGIFGPAGSVFAGGSLSGHLPWIPLSVDVSAGVSSRTGGTGAWVQFRSAYAFLFQDFSISPEISMQYNAGHLGLYLGAAFGFGFRNSVN